MATTCLTAGAVCTVTGMRCSTSSRYRFSIPYSFFCLVVSTSIFFQCQNLSTGLQTSFHDSCIPFWYRTGNLPEKLLCCLTIYTCIVITLLCNRGKRMKQTTRLISHLVAFTAVARVRTLNITILMRPFCAHEKKRGGKLYGRKTKIWAFL